MSQIGSIQRKLVTIIEEFKRSRDTWDEINSHSFTTANALTNSVIQSRYVDESKYWHPLLKLEFPDITQKYDSKMRFIIDKEHNKLLDLVNKMEKQYIKMKAQYKDMLAISQYVNKLGLQDQPIFLTCSIDSFVNRMKCIIEMYQQEINSKKSCLRGLKEIQAREEGVVLLSIWIQQPHLQSSALEEWEDIVATELTMSK